MKQRLLALMTTLALAAGLALPAFAAGELPGYYGDQSQCKMTVQQARTYAELLQGEHNKLKGQANENNTPHGYAALVDTGCGVPALLWVGVLENTTSDVMGFHLWQLQDGKLLDISEEHLPNLGFYVFPTHALLSSGDLSGKMEIYRYENGMIPAAPTSTGTHHPSYDSDDHIYQINERPVSEEAFDQWKAGWETEGQALCGAKCRMYNTAKVSGCVDADAVIAALNAYQGPAATACASTQTVAVDGRAVEFQMYALKDENGNLTNYVKVRDLAYVLSGTPAQFEVGYYGMVNLAPGQGYTPNGSEMKTPFSGDRAYTKSASQTNVGGELMDLDAIVLTDDAGGGYTYYQLRDLGKALGFNVGWSAAKGVFIETDKAYTDGD